LLRGKDGEDGRPNDDDPHGRRLPRSAWVGEVEIHEVVLSCTRSTAIVELHADVETRGAEPVETRRGLPGDPDDTHSRYIEAAIGGMLVGCLYLPNGNPAPGPKFDYKLRWFGRLTGYAQSLLDSGALAVLAGDFNVMPTELDVYAPAES
jgi:hypothetical protein